MSSDEFEKYLENRDPTHADKKWDSWFLPKITDIVRTTLRQMADVAIENRPNSFELYGFDFVLDKNLNPWLIEANMSPACAERKDWLIEMLDDMGSGVVNLIEAKVKYARMIQRHTFEVTNNAQNQPQDGTVKPTPILRFTKTFNRMKEEAVSGTCWVKVKTREIIKRDGRRPIFVPESQTLINVNQVNNIFQMIELQGTAININNERMLDWVCKKAASTVFIQKCFRGYLARK